MNISLFGKRALVTGAGKGIGRAICKKMVDCGAEIFALSRTKADLDSLKAEMPKVNTISHDLTDWDTVREEINKIGPLDLLVNNAGLTKLSLFVDTSMEDLDRMFDVNFKSMFNLSQVVAKGMIEKGKGGAIVNISSFLGKKVMEDFSAYCSSKAAVDMLTKCMAVELGRHNIRVNAVNPGVVWTPMTLQIMDYIKERENELMTRIPLGRLADVEDVATTVVFLLSDQSKMVTGECVGIDGGHTLG